MIELDGPEPLYQQVAVILEGRIKDGTYPPRTRIPGNKELAEEFGIGRRTGEAALTVLKAKGLVRGVVGKGTFVVGPSDD